MAMTVTLYKGVPVNGGSVATNKATLTDQLSYFNSFPSHVFNVNSVRLGDPIRLGKSIKELAGYTFGYIDYGDNFYYFFNVLDFTFITESQTEILYKIDAYETAINQCNVSFPRSYMTRYPVKAGDVHLPNEPYYWRDNTSPYTYRGCFIGVISVESGDGSSSPKTVLIPVSSLNNFTLVLNGDWLNKIQLDNKLLATDVYCFTFCPFDPPNGLELESLGWVSKEMQTSPYKIYMSDDRTLDIPNPFLGTPGATLVCDDPTRIPAIRDMRRNVVWRGAYGHSYTIQRSTLRVSASSATYQAVIVDGGQTEVLTIPCENVDIYADSWKEYYYRSRDSDKALRNIGYEQTLMSGIAGSLSGGVNGAIAGNVGSAGGLAGGLAGIGLGIVSSVGNYAISKYYDPQIQGQYDRQAIRQADILALAGELTPDMYVNNWAGLVTLLPDDISMTEYEKDVSLYGYSTVLYLSSDPRVYNDTRLTGAMRGSVDLSGDCPSAWLNEIAQRFNDGVRLI